MLDPYPAARRSHSQPRPRPQHPADLHWQDAPPSSSCSQIAKARINALAKRGLRIGRTPVGKGVFATKRIVDGSCIGEIQGQIIDDDRYVSRYAFDLDGREQLEPDAPFRFVNHSCEPNCAFECFSFPAHPLPSGGAAQASRPSTTPGERKLLLFAICDIAIGQELTIDYHWPAAFAIPCGCRASTCRGWIVTPIDLPKLVQSQRT